MSYPSPYHPDYTPDSTGSLHSLANERDNCGMGAIVHLGGERSYEILERAIDSVCNMTHRGAIDADGKTGDGSGILAPIPRPLFARELKRLDYAIDDIEDLAVGVFFLPAKDETATKQIMDAAVAAVKKRGITVLGWREVPINPDELGFLGLRTQPII
jgi:glutamate synthase domain-containing protein 1